MLSQMNCSPIRGHVFILLEAIKDCGALSSDSTRDTKMKGDRTDMIGVGMPQRWEIGCNPRPRA